MRTKSVSWYARGLKYRVLLAIGQSVCWGKQRGIRTGWRVKRQRSCPGAAQKRTLYAHDDEGRQSTPADGWTHLIIDRCSLPDAGAQGAGPRTFHSHGIAADECKYLESTASLKQHDYKQERAFATVLRSYYSRNGFQKFHIATVHSNAIDKWQPGERVHHAERSTVKPIEDNFSLKCDDSQKTLRKNLRQRAPYREISARASILRKHDWRDWEFCAARRMPKGGVSQVIEPSSHHSANDSRWSLRQREPLTSISTSAAKPNARLGYQWTWLVHVSSIRSQ